MTTEESYAAHLTAMWRIRALEEKVRDLRVSDDIVGSVHLCIGQEALAVGAVAALDSGDAVFSTYRGHGWAMAKGVPAEGILAELLGRASGLNGGRGGSAYFTAPRWGFYGENSIVGAGGPIACGAALAARYDGSGRVALTAFGEGALNQGSLNEALNFAAALSLPVVFFCENNLYSELTPTADMVADPELWKRGAAFGMPGLRIDGNDPEFVREATADAVTRARSGAGPTLIEAMTERLVGHYIGDAEQYRPAGEVDQARSREPLVRAGAVLRGLGWDEPRLAAIESAARAEIELAATAALASPLADPTTALEHLYA